MFSINGTGVRYLGVEPTEQPDVKYATLWVTFLFLPFFPLRRFKIRPHMRTPTRFEYTKVTRVSLCWVSIFKTYFFGWIVIPVVGIFPLIVSIREVAQFLNIPAFLEMPLLIGAIIWLIVYVWKVKDWDERRWFSKKII